MTVLYDVPGPKARRLSRVISILGTAIFVGLLIFVVVTLMQPRTNAGGGVTPGVLDPSRWDLIGDLALWRSILRGLTATLQMAGVAAVLAVALGMVLSIVRTANNAIVRVPAIIIIEFFRGMPVLLIMLFTLLIFSTGAYWAGVAGLALYNGAVIGEALRSGIASLPKGQRESGLAMGLTPLQARFSIEFPQAFRQMLPIIIAQLVVLLKDTSLAYIIGYQELLNIGLKQGPTTFGGKYLFTLFFVVLAVYLAVNLSLSAVARLVARRTAGGRTRKPSKRLQAVIAQLGGAGVGGAGSAGSAMNDGDGSSG